MAASKQYKVDNQPSATFRDISFSHSDTSIFEKIPSRLVVYPWEIGNVGASFGWQDALPHTNQLELGKRHWNLEKIILARYL